ncbi:MAG: metal ABC transporter permease [Armatimonadetes bacterium]|nr:metal ABC transporter permease [Armatimonadota bacterium]
MLDAFREPFVRTALIGGLIVGAVCAYLGVHVVLRRIVFVGAALAQVSSAGVGLALFAGLNPSITSLALTLVGVAAFSTKSIDRRTTQESWIGVGYAVAAALAILFVAKSAQAEARVLDLLSGDLLTVTADQIWSMAIVSTAAVTLHTLFHKQLLFCEFDAETAAACGLRAVSWDMIFFLILGAVISLSIRIAGTLLVFSFLVAPAVTALLVARSFAAIYATSIGSACISTVTGLIVSYKLDLPTGPTIAAVCCSLLLIAWVASKLR